MTTSPPNRGPAKPTKNRHRLAIAVVVVILLVAGYFTYAVLGFLKAFGCAFMLGLPAACSQ